MNLTGYKSPTPATKNAASSLLLAGLAMAVAFYAVVYGLGFVAFGACSGSAAGGLCDYATPIQWAGSMVALFLAGSAVLRGRKLPNATWIALSATVFVGGGFWLQLQTHRLTYLVYMPVVTVIACLLAYFLLKIRLPLPLTVPLTIAVSFIVGYAFTWVPEVGLHQMGEIKLDQDLKKAGITVYLPTETAGLSVATAAFHPGPKDSSYVNTPAHFGVQYGADRGYNIDEYQKTSVFNPPSNCGTDIVGRDGSLHPFPCHSIGQSSDGHTIYAGNPMQNAEPYDAINVPYWININGTVIVLYPREWATQLKDQVVPIFNSLQAKSPHELRALNNYVEF
jgi:hypothetical protein